MGRIVVHLLFMLACATVVKLEFADLIRRGCKAHFLLDGNRALSLQVITIRKMTSGDLSPRAVIISFR